MIASYLFHHTKFNMASSINGIGTTFYGQAAFEPDGSFVTTKWIIFAYLPIIPTASMRVRYAGEDKGFFSSSTSYEVIMDYPIDIGQVLRTWAYVISFIMLFATLDKGESSGWKVALLCAMALLPPHLALVLQALGHGRSQERIAANDCQRETGPPHAARRPAPHIDMSQVPVHPET